MNSTVSYFPQKKDVVTNNGFVRHQTDHSSNTDWLMMHADASQPRPCFSKSLLEDMRSVQRDIANRLAQSDDNDGPQQHLVLASEADVFNLGGDLELFAGLIRAGNRDGLLEYARLCVEVANAFWRLSDDRVSTIAVVQGDALGGGFEAALCCHTIIAEEGTGMGFPEVLFDLFPGMGAYTFLKFRVTPMQAERMMMDGKVYDAKELKDMGIVDYVVPKGEGLNAAREIIKRRRRIGNSLRAMNHVRHSRDPVDMSELMQITEHWVDAALRLGPKALSTMDRLVRAQRQRSERINQIAIPNI